MLRSRVIRPGIAVNEVLAGLGPYAEILFTRLWMLADREGRLEDRPLRIKAEGLPYYDVNVDDLLEKLAAAGFIVRYKVDHHSVIEVTNFRKHQPVHPHEAKSEFPPRPGTRSRSMTSNGKRQVRNVITSNGAAVTCNGAAVTSHGIFTSTFTKSSRRKGTGIVGPKEAVSTTTKPPAPEPQQAPLPFAKAPDPVPRKPPAVAHPRHRQEDVAVVSQSLRMLAAEVGLPPPDPLLVAQVMDTWPNATGEQMHALLAALFKRDKFRAIRTWGLVPLVVGQAVAAAS